MFSGFLSQTRTKYACLPPGGGGVTTIYAYGMCHVLECLFRAENKFWGFNFGKITRNHTFLGCHFRNITLLFWVLILIKFHLLG